MNLQAVMNKILRKTPQEQPTSKKSGYHVVDESETVRMIRFEDIPATWRFRRMMPLGVARMWMPKAVAALELGENAEVIVNANSEHALKIFQDVSDIIVLGSTLSWSYGPIDQETLEKAVPLHHYAIVGKMMEEMYRPFLDRSLSLLQNSYSLPSNGKSLSRQS